MALVCTLENALRDEQGLVRVFAEPFSLGFPKVIDHLGLYTSQGFSPNELVPEVHWHEELLRAWDTWDATEKF